MILTRADYHKEGEPVNLFIQVSALPRFGNDDRSVMQTIHFFACSDALEHRLRKKLCVPALFKLKMSRRNVNRDAIWMV